MLDCDSETTHLLQDCRNINALWAWLIVEECCRLGLTYFCIAPGSRSSPLTIAASSHPTITCISCFDERSLAFHAVGYARGSHKPAVIITTSGTAVSNLLPAVVEASQDCVPILLLTADRPPELQDAGANQSINQVNHFGSFVRFSFNLPPPTDLVPARMVLTTIDSAVNWATSIPYGPVHVNCPFREPLDNSQGKWMLSCLNGLDTWTHSSKPFTKYIQGHHSFVFHNTSGEMQEVINVIRGAKKGLLLIGAIHTEDDMWAAILLAKHLSWPVVADILSGVRLRKVLSFFPESEKNLYFVDHFDHALLSDAVRGLVKPDAVIQIGSRITSKRVSQMLEECVHCSYILVDSHPYRHDPSHIVTHRIQSTIVQFAECLLSTQLPLSMSNNWSGYLLAVNKMVASEILFQIQAENSLTEPHLANFVSEALSSKSALFIGNSMPIRDADMYAVNSENLIHNSDDMSFTSGLPFIPMRVVGNRGSSGIDGLLSSAAGFSMGCNKHVFCVIGDVSFLHDTNGLAVLAQRKMRKPMTVFVINNNGGAIFSLLPVADGTEQRVMNQFFYTTHNISIQKLCEAHGVKHLLVKTKAELQDALRNVNLKETDSVIEVGSCITANAAFHSNQRLFAKQAADHASSFLSMFFLSELNLSVFVLCKIHKMEFSLYRIQLCAPPTSSLTRDQSEFYREGFILSLYLEDGSMGFGEVAPLGKHRESLQDAEEQLRFLIHALKGAHISYFLPLLRGSFSSWIWTQLGLPTSSILPSVRCGLEMAILNAIAARQGSGLLNILHPHMESETEKSGTSQNVQMCALIDSNGTPSEVAHVASTLVKEGFNALKLKVARRTDPIQDAAVVQEVRNTIGYGIVLRVDANQNWTYDEAIQFGSLVKNCDLQYIEEPVQNENDIVKYCEQSGLPVALDETIDRICQDPLNFLAKYTHPGIVAVVIKPTFVGGFENSAVIAKWAQQMGKMAVVSAAFESGLGLSAYVVFSRFLDLQNSNICEVMNHGFKRIAHGLGTYKWLTEDVMTNDLGIYRNPQSGFVEASVGHATKYLQEFQTNPNVIRKTFIEDEVDRYQLTVDSMGVSFVIDVQEIGQSNSNNVVLFLHGFLGTGEDWIPIMKGLSAEARCISIDLPGHGRSKLKYRDGDEPSQDQCMSIEVISEMLYKLMEVFSHGKITLVGYSMGARIALYMALRFRDKIKGAVSISGSPGLRDKVARKLRTAGDDSMAHFLITHGLDDFLDSWYTGELWASLRSHPRFNKIVASRSLHEDVHGLAKLLSGLSVGRQPPLWEDLKNCSVPLSLIVGEKDRKFKTLARQMYIELIHNDERKGNPARKFHEIVEIPDCGHAAHVENPLLIISAVRKFLNRPQHLI